MPPLPSPEPSADGCSGKHLRPYWHAPVTQTMTTAATDPFAVMRTRSYAVLLILAAVVGAVVSVGAYWFLDLIANLTKWVYQPDEILKWLGFHGEPPWWPVPVLAVAGVIVGMSIRYLPGSGGEKPVHGFRTGGAPSAANLPGIGIAAIAGISLGAVIGPEMPLIALGSGLGAVAVRLAKKDAPPATAAVMAAAGGFAAISSLLGSPITAAFLLMEASALSGPAMTLVLIPGLLASGIGSLVFIGIGSLTGHGTYALALPALPHFVRPDVAEFGWALVIGLAAALLGSGLRAAAVWLSPRFERLVLVKSTVAGLLIAGVAVAYFEGAGHPSSDVLFSGQSGLPALVTGAAGYSVGALILLLACKGIGYCLSLASFRGGPTFPAMYLGAAGGIAMSHLPGLPEVPALAMGIGAMAAVMLRLPMTSVLLATILLGANGITTAPLAIVAVVVAYVVSNRIGPLPPRSSSAPAAPAGATSPAQTPGQTPGSGEDGGRIPSRASTHPSTGDSAGQAPVGDRPGLSG